MDTVALLNALVAGLILWFMVGVIAWIILA